MAPPAAAPPHTTTYVHVSTRHGSARHHALPLTRRYITNGISASDPNVVNSGLLELGQPSEDLSLGPYAEEVSGSVETVVSRPVSRPVQKLSVNVSIGGVRPKQVSPPASSKSETAVGKGKKRGREEANPPHCVQSKKVKFSEDCTVCVGAKARLREKNKALEKENQELKAKFEMIKAVLKDPAKLNAWTEKLRGLKAATVSAG